VVLPERGFLEGPRKICDGKGILLFFIEGPVSDYRSARMSGKKRLKWVSSLSERLLRK
jgi:hypothetical protein